MSVDRREFLSIVATASEAFVLGFWVPIQSNAQSVPGAAWYEDPATPEINAWIVISPDDTVTIRIGQTELGQGVWTSNAMMVAEELQCDWNKVRPQYAGNRLSVEPCGHRERWRCAPIAVEDGRKRPYGGNLSKGLG